MASNIVSASRHSSQTSRPGKSVWSINSTHPSNRPAFQRIGCTGISELLSCDLALQRLVPPDHLRRKRCLVFLQLAATSGSPMPIIWAASTAALRAPLTATHATGTPGGIWAMLRRASKPPNVPEAIGTPITGTIVWAAITPGNAAAMPAAAMISRYPSLIGRAGEFRDGVGRAVGTHDPHIAGQTELAEQILARLHGGQSESLPMMIAIFAVFACCTHASLKARHEREILLLLPPGQARCRPNCSNRRNPPLPIPPSSKRETVRPKPVRPGESLPTRKGIGPQDMRHRGSPAASGKL